MPSDPHEPHRRSIRLQDYDYSQSGSYFVTICTQRKKWLFGNVTASEMLLNNHGKIAQSNWVALPERFPNIEIDQHVVMPNHLHGIITILDTAPPHPAGAMNCAPTLGQIIRVFKAVTSGQIRSQGKADFEWQRGYYEHIVRKDGELNRIPQYIIDNPARWTEDSLYREEEG